MTRDELIEKAKKFWAERANQPAGQSSTRAEAMADFALSLETKSEELKPCPFCGRAGGDYKFSLFGCSYCDVWCDTPKEWNTRVESAENARLRKELKAANKGAQTNALINQSLSKQLWELREKLAAAEDQETKHDVDCDCGICQYCSGTEDVYGNSTAPIKIANLEAEIAQLREKLAAVREIVAEYANPEAHIYVDEYGKEILRDDLGHVRAQKALAIIDGNDVLKEGM